MRSLRLASLSCVAALAIVAAGCDASNKPSTPTTSTAPVSSLHRGELSAVAAYEDALTKFPNLAQVDLASLRDEHRDSASRLSTRLTALGAKIDTTAGPWGTWAEAVTKTAGAFGDDAALHALLAGERHGLAEYDDALASKSVDETTKMTIRDLLKPRQERHIREIEGALKSKD